MGSIISQLKGLFSSGVMKEISMVGLDSAGKTTILYQMKLCDTVETIPTIGFNVESFNVGSTVFHVWDIGGQDEIRPLWGNYIDIAKGIVFVVDIVDSARWAKAGEVLHRILEGGNSKPVLILANKADDPHDPNLEAEVKAMIDTMGVYKLTVPWEVFHVSAINCPTNPNPTERLLPAFQWMADCLKKHQSV
ncbi:ADP-ribosylation factor [Astathelohania contejeani]|uniref:ADP-ribosylation factor n=1 Tax=Astathelohania contejeani TaxID=164912 RepID=A0ABQ7HWU4_9MICR|nr:ADP-ribosylation factor [Thelohania contejeani]